MPKQTIASIRGQIEKNRDGSVRDPDGYLKSLPGGDPRLEWTLRLYDDGRPVLSLRRAGDTGRIGLIQPGSFGYWGGSVFVDGEQIRLRCDAAQPDRLHVALHLYGLAIELLNSEEANDADSHNQGEAGESPQAGEERAGIGTAAAMVSVEYLGEPDAGDALPTDPEVDGEEPVEGSPSLPPVAGLDDPQVDGVE